MRGSSGANRMDELSRKRLGTAIERALRTLPTPGTYMDDAIVLIKVLRRWYGDEARNVLQTALGMLLDPNGCAVCGDAILADTQEWPAPLCVAHAPKKLLDYLDRQAFERQR